MNNPLVSIIIPAYNAEQWIAEAVNSCLNQSYKHIEVIVVNDGSTDDTLTVVQQIDDKRLKVFSQMKMGACVARNRGFDESAGEYVKFFDADDYMYPDAIEKQLHHILTLPKGWISIGRFSVQNQIRNYDLHIDCNGRYIIEKAITDGFQTAVGLYPRCVFESIGGFDINMEYSQDHELTLNCCIHDCRFACTNSMLFKYNNKVNATSISNSRNHQITTLIYLYYKYKDLFSNNNYRRLYIQSCVSRIFGTHLYDADKLMTFLHKIAKGKMKFRYHGSRTFGMLFWIGTKYFSISRVTSVLSPVFEFIQKAKKHVS